MPEKAKSIPVNPMLEEFGTGIAIGRTSVKELSTIDGEVLRAFKMAQQSHRDDYHLFFLQEEGTMPIEIDFQKHDLKAFSLIYIHPSQVHRMIAFENVTVSFLAINNENLNAGYLKLLQYIAPSKPLMLDRETFSLISETVLLCLRFSERKQERLYHALLKDSCNTLVALITSQYLIQSEPADALSRFEVITRAFKSALEHDFIVARRPADYARKLHISAPYLNECVKNVTGYPVSYHIHQRIILEAKRFLYHSGKSVKEIASVLGFEDYAYFSRLFNKVAGMTPLAFRSKNLD